MCTCAHVQDTAVRCPFGLRGCLAAPRAGPAAPNHLAEKGKLDIVAIAESSVKAKALPWTSPEPLEPYAAASRCCEDLNFNAVTEAQDQYGKAPAGRPWQRGPGVVPAGSWKQGCQLRCGSSFVSKRGLFDSQ